MIKVIAETEEQINTFKKHGDNWEAELLEGYLNPLKEAMKNITTITTGVDVSAEHLCFDAEKK